MQEETKDRLLFFLIGVLVGIGVSVYGGVKVYKVLKGGSFGFGGARRAETTSTQPAPPDRKKFLLGFEDKSDFKMFKPNGATMEISNHHAAKGKRSLLVTLKSGASYPGIAWEVYGRQAQNWKGFKSFDFNVYNNTEDFVRLEIKFKSGKKYPKKSYSYVVELDPLDQNHVSIPMENIASKCNLQEMSYIKIFAKSPQTNLALFFDEIGTK